MTNEQDADRAVDAAADSPQAAEVPGKPEPDAPPAVESAVEPALAVVPDTIDTVDSLGPLDSPTIVAPPPDYSAAGVPSLDFVRDKIEGRYARSLGSTELAEATPEARSFEEQAAKRDEAAQEKLAAIRRSLRDGSTS